MPAADDLFRPTVVPDHTVADPEGDAGDQPAEGKSAKKGPSGRVRHDEKMTVYITSDELLDLEHARLTLRRNHGLAVDRGRFVRAAVAIALADLDDNGDQSVIVQRLTKD
jgi:hypothetical protein